MVSLGLLSDARTFECEPQVRQRSREECVENKLEFTVVQGHRFQQYCRFLRFNSETGEAEAMPECQGATVKASIRVPNYSIDISLSHEESGQQYSGSVELSESESQELVCMKDETERQSYINSLQCVKDGYRQLAIQAGLLVQKPC